MRYGIEIIVFVCGAVLMIFELVGSRILGPYLGTTIFVWTSLIGIILASLSIGYWLGGVNIVSNGTVQNCKITNCQARDGGGIAIDNGGIVQNCLIRNNSADNNSNNGYGGGVRCLNGGIVRNCLITENISKKYGGGVNIWNAGTIQSCIITKNTAPNGAGVRTRKNSLVNNTIIYFNNGANWQVSGSGYSYNNSCSTPALPNGTNNITANPLFVSTISGSEDYHFQSGSPCIDVGLFEAWMNTATDLDGNLT